MAALRSFTEPIVLLVGGRDKHLPWDDAARLMLKTTHTVIVFGEAAPIITETLEKVASDSGAKDTQVLQCANLDDAVQLAAQVAQPGDVVLLSPGCSSYDAFTNYTKRGERFKELVAQLK